MKYLASLLFAFLLSVPLAFSQNGLTVTAPTAPDTVMENAVETLTIYIHNNDSIAVSGSVDVNLAVASAQNPIVTETINGQIAPGDSLAVALSVTFSQVNGFVPGGNIVVIWPEAPIIQVDTLQKGIYIIPAPAALDSLGAFEWATFPVPTVFHQNKPVGYQIRNTGNQTVNRSVKVYAAVTLPSFTKFDSTDALTLNNIVAGGAETAVFADSYTKIQALAPPGGNTIVIWPESPPNDPDPYITTDSMIVDFDLAPTGIFFRNPEESTISVFPNPSNGLVNIQSTDAANTVHHVRITDLSGRLVEQHGFLRTLNVEAYETGYYMIEVTLKDGTQQNFKFYRF